MTQHAWLDPSPFFLEGGPVGCLLVHGFTGSPPEMRLLGDYLAARGLTVSGPLLAGHGTSPEEMAQTTWGDWYASAETAYLSLKERCDTVFVGGLSMGAVLALRIAAFHDVSGVLAYSPGLKARDWRLRFIRPLRHIMRWNRKEEPQDADLTDPEASKRLWSYDIIPGESAYQLVLLQRDVTRRLADITAPLLIFQSTGDAMIPPEVGQELLDAAGSADKELVLLHNSGHCITVDSEREFVFEQSYNWISERT